MTLHIHLHDDDSRDARLAHFTGEFIGFKPDGKRVSFTAGVEAIDHYAAGDKLKEMARRRFGEGLHSMVIRFGASRLPAGSISLSVAQHAGAEEDSVEDRIPFSPVDPDDR